MNTSSFLSSSTLASHVTSSKDAFGDYGDGSYYGGIQGSSYNKPIDVTNDANPMDGDDFKSAIPAFLPPTTKDDDDDKAQLQRQLYETKQQLETMRSAQQQVVDWNNRLSHDLQEAQTALAQERAAQDSRIEHILRNERNKHNQAVDSFISLTFTKRPQLFPSHLVTDDDGVLRNCTIGATMGKGAFGNVVRAQQLKSKKQFALKLVAADCDYLQYEVHALTRISHPNIVKLHDILIDKPSNKYGFVLELGAMDLLTYLEQGNVCSLEDLRQISLAVLKALAYLHSQKMCHMDIKPDNIMIMRESPKLLQQDIKLCDLGLVAIQKDGSDKPYVTESGMKGTTTFFAPEAGSFREYNAEAADMWSFGATLLLLQNKMSETWVNTYLLIRKEDDVNYRAFCTGLRVIAREMSDEEWTSPAMDLAARLIKYNPDHRLTAEQALGHPWLAE